MKNIITQDGCWNCKFLYVFSEQDEPITLYCNVTQDRPHSGALEHDGYKFDHTESHLYDMNNKKLPEKEMLRRIYAWREWQDGKEVKPNQKCDLYEKENL